MLEYRRRMSSSLSRMLSNTMSVFHSQSREFVSMHQKVKAEEVISEMTSKQFLTKSTEMSFPACEKMWAHFFAAI